MGAVVSCLSVSEEVVALSLIGVTGSGREFGTGNACVAGTGLLGSCTTTGATSIGVESIGGSVVEVVSTLVGDGTGTVASLLLGGASVTGLVSVFCPVQV